MQSTRHRVGIAALCAWGLLLAPAAQAMPAPGDAAPTDPAVIDNTGAARLRIPIEVAPGPGGFAPNLGLAYSSRSGDGPLGIGWSLGIPEIRCSDRFGVPDYSDCAKYELGSVLLVEDPATPNAYHTFVESFQRIRYHPASDSWTVEQPNGSQLIFGELPSHRISQAGATARWLLQRMEDSFGNQIFLEYDTATDVGSAYLRRVFYGAGATATAGPREVRFEYQDRPDARDLYSGGMKRKITRRLREIQVFGHGQIFKRYAFGYDLPGESYATDRSRLSWVKEFGTDCAVPGADPVASCTGLPRQEFRYRDAPGSYDGEDGYRIPFGAYPGLDPAFNYKFSLPQLIGDINGDGLPDRMEIRPNIDDLFAPGTMRVFLNTGAGFSDSGASAAAYQASFDGLTYAQPRLNYEQIPAPMATGNAEAFGWNFGWNGEGAMFAMCSVTPTTRLATLSQELSTRGFGAATSRLATLLDSAGAPSAGFIEPRPTVKLVDLDADGLADLVISVRLGGVDRHFDCGNPGTPLATPQHFEPQTSAVVFRNTGNGWANDAAAQALAAGLPPFEELIVKSSYQTEVDEPATRQLTRAFDYALSPCANFGYLGFEWNDYNTAEDVTAVCHVPIDLSPQFIDFNGDGLLDLAVIQRDDPDLLWTGHNWRITADFGATQEPNRAKTRVWIQTPNGSRRWTWAPQFDLPVGDSQVGSWNFAHVMLFHDTDDTEMGQNCYSWSVTFWECGPNSFVGDAGVRLADMNGDGLADVVWNTVGNLYWHFDAGGASGVLLNTGGGSEPSSAWCASNPEDVPLVGSACPDAAIYVPPSPFIRDHDLLGNRLWPLGFTVGWLRDLNGDGLLDFVQARVTDSPASWIQSPDGTTPQTRWRRDTDFDFAIDWTRSVTNPLCCGFVGPPPDTPSFIPGFQIFDVNGDGSADFVGDQHALLSRSRHSDLIERVDNGRGGRVEIEYAPASTQRTAALEAAAAAEPETPGGSDATLWRSAPVVSRVEVSGAGFATAATEYRYAHPRYCSAFRSDLGFRLVEQTRPDGSKVEEYFYQDHGRAGHSLKRLVKDGGQVVHRYQASWEVLTAAIPGSIPGVFVGRLAWEESKNEYLGASGALLRRTFAYDDTHGFNFVREIRTERPTATLIDTRTPVNVSETGPYVPGRIGQRTLTDGSGTLFRDTRFTYLDLGGNPTGPKVGTRSEFIADRGSSGGAWVDVLALRYDAYGNRTEERTPRPGGGARSTLFCYDGDEGWCPSPADQSSHSVLVASQDPSGKVTRFTPDSRSGTLVAADSDYTDEPARRITLDPYGRPAFVYATSTGGSEVLVAKNLYHDGDAPLRVERFEYVDETATDSIYSAEIFGSFGGVWKSVAATPSGYAGTMTFWDPAARRTHSTLPLDCDGDPTCAAFSGQTQAAARAVETDALGRPLRVDTPDGYSLLAYRPVVGRWGEGLLDAALERNAKGDLLDRALDGDRVVWVDECHGSESCGAADTTRYSYEATGEIRSVHDPRAVVSGDFDDPSRRLRYGYDTLGRVVRIEDPDLAGTGHSLTTYSDAGNLSSTTNARGQVRSFSYDVLDRLVGISTPAGEDDYTIEYRSTQWQREKDFSQAYERVRIYDGWGRLQQSQLSVVEDTGPVWGNWSGSYFMDFEYDLAGRPVEVLYPESTVVRYEYAGAYLERVCDLGDAQECSDGGVVEYVSGVTYDGLGRREITESAAGTRTFSYDGSLPRLLQDRFDAPSAPSSYFLELNYTAYDELGNLTAMTGSSQPNDIELGQSFAYDRRNRLDSWTKQGTTHDFGYDELGNLTNHAGSAQVFSDPSRPHALQSRAGGAATYSHDADGNVTSIASPGGARYFQFDSASRMVCADTVEGGCALNRLHYDVDGRRVLDDHPMSMKFAAFVEDSVSVDGGLYTETRIEIRAFGERIAYKRSGDDFRTAGGSGGLPWELPPEAPGLLVGLCLLGLLAGSARQQGTLVLVLQRPGYAGVSAVLVVVLVLGPLPGVPVSKAGGGGEANFYWELSDPLGTGMVMLDETGARKLHRTYTPFGVEHASAGAATWLPRHYAGHLADEDSGLVYMQARWMDPESGTFLSVDPVVADAADPQAFNAYAYARNNPVSYIDPTGESCFSIPLFGGTICMGYEGGYFPGPNGFVESGYSGPGPSAAPVDSVGSLLSSLMNLGGSETPRSQGDFRPTGTFISQISGAIDEGEVGLFEVTEHVEDLALKNRGLDTFDIELRIKNKGDSPADVLVQTFETQDRFSNAGTRIEPSGRLVNIRDISPDETRMIRVPLPRRPDMPRPMYPNQRLFFAVRPSGGPVSLDARVVARGVSL